MYLILFIALLTITTQSGCANNAYMEKPEGDGYVTLFNSGLLFSLDADQAQVVIRNPDGLKSFLLDYPLREGYAEADYFGPVDFSRHMIIGMALGTRGSGSIKVYIDSIAVNERSVHVFSKEYVPLVQTRDMANPSHFVVLKQSNLPVRFEELRKEVENSR